MVNGDQGGAGLNAVRFGRRGMGAGAAPQETSAGFGRRVVAQPAPNAAAEATTQDGAATVPHREAYDVGTAIAIEDELATFIGPNAETYLRAYRLSGASKALAPPSPLSWRLSGADRLWAGFFFPVPWLFYRKLYGHGSAALAATLVCALLGSSLASAVVGIAISSLVMRYGKRLYVERALNAVALADQRGLSGGERASYLRRAGGLSTLGLVVGLLLLVVPIAWMILGR
jgi:hypothetical protein